MLNNGYAATTEQATTEQATTEQATTEQATTDLYNLAKIWDCAV